MGLEFNAQAQRPEAADQAAIEALIAKNLTDGLQLLPEEDLASALHDFVEKVCPSTWPKAFLHYF